MINLLTHHLTIQWASSIAMAVKLSEDNSIFLHLKYTFRACEQMAVITVDDSLLILGTVAAQIRCLHTIRLHLIPHQRYERRHYQYERLEVRQLPYAGKGTGAVG